MLHRWTIPEALVVQEHRLKWPRFLKLPQAGVTDHVGKPWSILKACMPNVRPAEGVFMHQKASLLGTYPKRIVADPGGRRRLGPRNPARHGRRASSTRDLFYIQKKEV